MKYENPTHIKKQVLWGFGLIISLFILVGVISFIEINSLGSLTTTIYRHPLKVSNAALRASTGTVKMHRDMKDVVLAKNPASLDLAIRRVAEEEKRVLNHLDVVSKTILGSAGQSLAEKTRELFINWRPIRNEVIQLAKNGEIQKAAQITKSKSAAHELLVERQMFSLTSYAHKKADGFIAQAMRVKKRFSIFSGITVTIGTFLSLLIAFYTIQKAAKTLAIQEKAGNDLRESEQRFKDFMMSADEGFVHYDSSLNLIGINTKALEVFPSGSTEENMLGKNMLEISPGLKKSGRYEEYLNVLNTGKPLYFTDLVPEPFFGDRHLSLKAFKVSDGLGIIFTDITETVHAEQCEKKHQSQLHQAAKMQAVGTLAGGIAHEFNNFLGIIMGCADIARDEVPEDSFANTQLDKIMKASFGARDLAKQILTFSRQPQSQRISANLSPLVKESVKLIESSIPSSIEIQTNIEPACKNVIVDPTEIQQIVLNICANAVWAMKEKGTLNISLKEVQLTNHDELTAKGLSADGYAKLSFSDTGAGMDKDTQAKIFDPFFTTKDVGQDSGMGLSIIYGIMKSNGGTITVDSEVGKGTAFHLYFPVTEASATEESAKEKEYPGGSERILFVDDEVVYAETAEKMISRFGYDVDLKINSAEALESFRSDPDSYDLVITDQIMPELSGEELITEIRKIRPDIPIILCTGYSTQMDEEKANILGINAFALKPIAKNDFARLIREALDD